MRSRIMALILIVLVLMAGVGIVQQGYRTSVREGAPQTAVTNETWAVDEGNVTTLTESNRDVVYAPQRDIVVRYNNDTVPAEGNWTWNAGNGTVKALSGSTFTDGDTAKISYRYADGAPEQELARNIGLFAVSDLSGTFIEIGGVAMLLAAFVVFARAGGR